MKKLISLVLALMLVLCAVPSLADTLIMATNAAFAPFEYIETENPVVVTDGVGYAGIDFAIADAIAKKMGYDGITVMDIEFGAIINAVTSGKADFGMAGMSVTEERKQSVNFSLTYYNDAVQVIILPIDSELTMEDLFADGASYICGVQESTTGDLAITEDLDDSLIQRFPNGNEAVTALMNGKIDFVVIDSEPAKNFVASNEGKLKILEATYASEEYAACFALENEELLTKFNAALEELMADGTVDAIIASYSTEE